MVLFDCLLNIHRRPHLPFSDFGSPPGGTATETGKAVGRRGPTAPSPTRTGLGLRGLSLRKQARFERRVTLESIDDQLVFNKQANLRTSGQKRNPKPCGELRPLLGVPGRHSNAELKNAHPAKRTICCSDIPRRIEINVTPSGASAGLPALSVLRGWTTL